MRLQSSGLADRVVPSPWASVFIKPNDLASSLSEDCCPLGLRQLSNVLIALRCAPTDELNEWNLLYDKKSEMAENIKQVLVISSFFYGLATCSGGGDPMGCSRDLASSVQIYCANESAVLRSFDTHDWAGKIKKRRSMATRGPSLPRGLIPTKLCLYYANPWVIVPPGTHFQNAQRAVEP